MGWAGRRGAREGHVRLGRCRAPRVRDGCGRCRVAVGQVTHVGRPCYRCGLERRTPADRRFPRWLRGGSRHAWAQHAGGRGHRCVAWSARGRAFLRRRCARCWRAGCHASLCGRCGSRCGAQLGRGPTGVRGTASPLHCRRDRAHPAADRGSEHCGRPQPAGSYRWMPRGARCRVLHCGDQSDDRCVLRSPVPGSAWRSRTWWGCDCGRHADGGCGDGARLFPDRRYRALGSGSAPGGVGLASIDPSDRSRRACPDGRCDGLVLYSLRIDAAVLSKGHVRRGRDLDWPRSQAAGGPESAITQCGAIVHLAQPVRPLVGPVCEFALAYACAHPTSLPATLPHVMLVTIAHALGFRRQDALSPLALIGLPLPAIGAIDEGGTLLLVRVRRRSGG